MTALAHESPSQVRHRTRSSYPVRIGTVTAVVVVMAGLQLSLAGPLSAIGLMPNLLLLVVIGAAVSRGRDFAVALGFGLGLSLDLGPASDHLAGRWALAFVVVGFVVGSAAHLRLRNRSGSEGTARLTRWVLIAVAAAGSFVGTSVFALTGLLLRDPITALSEVLGVIVQAAASDALFGLVLLGFLISVFDRLTPPQES